MHSLDTFKMIKYTYANLFYLSKMLSCAIWDMVVWTVASSLGISFLPLNMICLVMYDVPTLIQEHSRPS